MPEWHLISGHYPPEPGGLSGYSQLIASELAAAGDVVHVWSPRSAGKIPEQPGVFVHPELGGFAPADLRRVDKLLTEFSEPRRLLLQWVPHVYGYRSMNLAFCLWLWKRAAVDGDQIEIVVHEAYLRFDGSVKQHAAAVVHRIMTTVLLIRAEAVWLAALHWEVLWRPYALGRRIPFSWLPVPSNIPVVHDPPGVAVLRSRYVPAGGAMLGHFGTYPRLMVEQLLVVLPAILAAEQSVVVLLLGRGGKQIRDDLIGRCPEFAKRVHATGELDPHDVSRYLQACDLIVQPYPDGVTSRRTSIMAALCHGLPIVTTVADSTESLWIESGAVALAPAKDYPAFVELVHTLLENKRARDNLGDRAGALYRGRFDVKHTIRSLRREEIQCSPAL